MKKDSTQQFYISKQWESFRQVVIEQRTITNLQAKHSLIFVFGDVNYYFITSSGTCCRLFPDGQVVKLDGDGYRLVIVPNSNDATVTITDNNVDRTSLLEYE